jgi:serpin B
MVRFLMTILLAISLLLGIGLRSQKGAVVIDRDTSPVIGGNNQFAIDLLKAIRSRPGNVSFSPASLSTALAMTYEGARGQTADEMARVCHFPSDREAMRAGFRGLMARLNGDGGPRPYRLVAANSLWGQKGDPFRPEYTALVAHDYGAELHAVDFRRTAEPARREINGWVDVKTERLIPELLPSGTLDASTSLVLVNTVYFKGTWQHPFAKAATAPADFHLDGNTTVQVPTMRQRQTFPYAEADGYRLLEMPYKGGDLAFDILLPNEGVPISKVEADLSTAGLQNALDRLQARDAAVEMPKFKLTAASEMSKTLSGMGMPTAFTSEADFSGIDGTHELAISAVMHQVVVNLDEEGTEAAAATGVVITRSAVQIRPAPVPFRVDRPFLYAIRDVKTGAILFFGRVADPRQ